MCFRIPEPGEDEVCNSSHPFGLATPMQMLVNEIGAPGIPANAFSGSLRLLSVASSRDHMFRRIRISLLLYWIGRFFLYSLNLKINRFQPFRGSSRVCYTSGSVSTRFCSRTMRQKRGIRRTGILPRTAIFRRSGTSCTSPLIGIVRPRIPCTIMSAIPGDPNLFQKLQRAYFDTTLIIDPAECMH